MCAEKTVTRVIVHAGLPKTATTSIQNAIFAQREALLAQHGILYPGDNPNHTNALCTAFLTDPRKHISNKIAGDTDLDALLEKAAGIRDDFQREIEASGAQTVLFSAEGLSNLSAVELTGLRDWVAGFCDRLDVFYVARSPLNFVTSVIQQMLKGGEVLERLYQSPPMPNFKGRFNAGRQAFGAQNVAIHTFEDMCADPAGIVGAFLDIAGVTQGDVRAAILAGQQKDNESLSHEAVLLLSALNEQIPLLVGGKIAARMLGRELAVLGEIKGGKFRLPDPVARKVIENAAEDVAWLRETYGITRYDNLNASLEEAAASQGEALSSAAVFSQVAVASIAVIFSTLTGNGTFPELLAKLRGDKST